MAGRIIPTRDTLTIQAPYNAGLIAAIKGIQGRKYIPDTKCWTVPIAQTETLLPIAQEYNLIWPGQETAVSDAAATVKVKNDTLTALGALSRAHEVPTPIAIPGFTGTLRHYQEAGVAYMLAAPRSIEADDMGLGKTAQTLAAVEAAGDYPALVIAPASLVLNWRNEIRRWLPGRTIHVVRKSKDGLDATADVTVMTYDLAKKFVGQLIGFGFKSVIGDEAHYLKNEKAQRTAKLTPLVQGIARAHLLTGTPITNRPADLISLLKMLGLLDTAFGGWYAFARRYCQAYQGDYGWDLSGAAYLDELNEKLRQTCLVRRTKAEVLTELPPKVRVIQPVELSGEGERAYRDLEGSFLDWLRNASQDELESAEGKGKILEMLNALRQAAGVAKIEPALEAIAGYQAAGRKVVVFCHHHAVMNGISEALEPGTWVRIDGTTTLDKRQAAVDRFQSDPTATVFVASTKAAGVGLTLTAASDVLIVEQEWVAADLDQAEDRCHRIGQTGSVQAVHLIAEDTVDARLQEAVERKRAIAEAAITGQGGEAPMVSGSVLQDVLGAYLTQAKNRSKPRLKRGSKKAQTAMAEAA